MNKKFVILKRLILTMAIVFLTIGVLSSSRIFYKTDHLLAGFDNLYTQTVLSDLPTYSIDEQDTQADPNIYSLLQTDSLIQAYDVQAYSAQKQGFSVYWYPHCLATPVIAIDREITDMKIVGWKDLASTNLPVSISDKREEKQLILAAISYGLEGEDYSLESAEQLLGSLQDHHLLKACDPSAPLIICMDYQAVALKKEGRNLEIVVPCEGTYSYYMGLLSGHPLPKDPIKKETLVQGGLRLDDGASYPLYPDESSYQNASTWKNDDKILSSIHTVSTHYKTRIFKTNRFLPVNLRNRTIFAVFIIIVTLLWTKYMITRSIRPDIKKGFYAIAFFIVGWMLVRICKYPVSSYSLANRILWYAFYVFQIGLPLSMLYISAVIDHPEPGYKLPGWLKAFLYPYPFFVLLVFTNDIHQMVFEFNPSGNWSDDYTYRIGYFLIFAYLGIAFFLSIGMLIYKSRKGSSWLSSLIPVLLGLLIFGYCIGYCLNLSAFRRSDFAVIMCLFSLIFSIAVLFTGLVPKNSYYTKVFESSPLNIQLLDLNGEPKFRAAAASVLTNEEIQKLQEGPSIHFEKGKDTLLYGQQIHNGTAVWTKDISTLNQLNSQIESSNQQLTAANSILCKTRSIRQKKYSMEIKNRIFSELEKETKAKILELSSSINSDAKLSYISLLLCYIKRRCNLFFIDKEQLRISGANLSSYLNELSEFASYSNIRAMFHTDLSISLELCEAILCYDFYFELLKWSYYNSNATLLGQLSFKKGNILFHVMSSEDLRSLHFSSDFKEALALQEGTLTTEYLDETSSISLTFIRKEDL